MSYHHSYVVDAQALVALLASLREKLGPNIPGAHDERHLLSLHALGCEEAGDLALLTEEEVKGLRLPPVTANKLIRKLRESAGASKPPPEQQALGPWLAWARVSQAKSALHGLGCEVVSDLEFVEAQHVEELDLQPLVKRRLLRLCRKRQRDRPHQKMVNFQM